MHMEINAPFSTNLSLIICIHHDLSLYVVLFLSILQTLDVDFGYTTSHPSSSTSAICLHLGMNSKMILKF